MQIRSYEGNGSEDLSGPEALEVVDRILELDPTFGVKPEAYNLEEGLAPGVEERFREAGHKVWYGRCSEPERGDARAILGFAKEESLDPDMPSGLIELAGRTAVELWLRDPKTGQQVHGVGGHENDRPEENVEETKELLTHVLDLDADIVGMEIEELLAYLKEESRIPVPSVVWGDLNSMHRWDSLRPSVLPGVLAARNIAMLVDKGLIPNKPPQTVNPEMNLGRIGNLAVRYRGMSLGASMSLLKAAGFIDADKWHRPTAAQKSILRGQIDHTMFSSRNGQPDFHVLSFRRLPRQRGHDHYESLADLELLQPAA